MRFGEPPPSSPPLPPVGSFPVANAPLALPWMNWIGGVLNQGNDAAGAFDASLARLQAGRGSSSTTPYVLAGVGLLGVGILAYALTRK